MADEFMLADLIAERLDVLFCGINPAMSAAKSGHHFSNGSNRFWKVMHGAGFTPRLVRAEEDASILEFGYGLTAAVARPTVRASEVGRGEFDAAAAVLEKKVRRYRPRFLAFLGKPAFAAISGEKKIAWGPQPEMWGVQVWVLPNPSGLNRAFTLQQLVKAYSELRVAVHAR